jgi:hypothetical protein
MRQSKALKEVMGSGCMAMRALAELMSDVGFKYARDQARRVVPSYY